MTEKSVRAVFKGEILPGQNLEAVKKNLAVMLKLNERQIDGLFSGKRIVLWKRTDALKADKIKSAFEKAGAILSVEALPSEPFPPEEEDSQNRDGATASEPPKRKGEPPSGAPPVRTPLFTVGGPGNEKTRDLPAMIVFVTALIIFFCLGGYLVWLGIKPQTGEKRTLKQVTRSTQATVKRSISPKRPTARHRRESLSEDDRFLLRRLREQGLGHVRKGEYKKAESPYRKRLVIMAEKGKRGYHALPAALNDLAYVLREQNRHKEAERLYLEAIKICRDQGKGEDLSVAVASEGLAKIYLAQGKLQKIDPLYQVAIKIWDRVSGPDNGNSLGIKQSRAELLEKLGRKDEAKALKDYVFKVRKRLWEERAKGRTRTGDHQKNVGLSLAKADRIPVSITGDFSPVGMTIAAMSGYHSRLTNEPPQDILKEPRYRGKRQKYGRLVLGTHDNKTYYFVLDLRKGPHPVLYFDKNGNRDLTDDGPPLKNRGTGIFGTTISIPIRRLIKELDSRKNFQIWFFTNKALWPKGITRHYSRTQMKGRVIVNGKPYLAYIAEREANDADFTNDGICVDLNGNGKIELMN